MGLIITMFAKLPACPPILNHINFDHTLPAYFF